VLKKFSVATAIDGKPILCRLLQRRKEKQWFPVVPIEDVEGVVTAHHERSVCFGGIKMLWTHVRSRVGGWMGGSQAMAGGCRHGASLEHVHSPLLLCPPPHPPPSWPTTHPLSWRRVQTATSGT
jgi:hypothetical protein